MFGWKEGTQTTVVRPQTGPVKMNGGNYTLVQYQPAKRSRHKSGGKFMQIRPPPSPPVSVPCRVGIIIIIIVAIVVVLCCGAEFPGYSRYKEWTHNRDNWPLASAGHLLGNRAARAAHYVTVKLRFFPAAEGTKNGEWLLLWRHVTVRVNYGSVFPCHYRWLFLVCSLKLPPWKRVIGCCRKWWAKTHDWKTH